MVTKQTRRRKVRQFAHARIAAWNQLESLVDKRCKSKKDREKFLDELTVLVDTYIDLNERIGSWCRKNEVNCEEFACDVCNEESDMIACSVRGDRNGKGCDIV